jgi:hypothetical protein
MVKVLSTVISNDLKDLVVGNDDDAAKLENEEFEDLIAKYYPDTGNFVNNVASAMEERGFSKAQVAAAMGETALPFFADYIARNGGDTRPVPIVPASRPPISGIPPPMYGPPPPSGPPSVTSTTAMGREVAAVPGWISAYPNRSVLKQKLNTVEKVRAFMESVPSDVGLKAYTPRLGTDMRSVWETLIRNIREVVPNY